MAETDWDWIAACAAALGEMRADGQRDAARALEHTLASVAAEHRSPAVLAELRRHCAEQEQARRSSPAWAPFGPADPARQACRLDVARELGDDPPDREADDPGLFAGRAASEVEAALAAVNARRAARGHRLHDAAHLQAGR